MIESNTVLTITSACFFVSSETRETSSTSSALVMAPRGSPPSVGSVLLICIGIRLLFVVNGEIPDDITDGGAAVAAARMIAAQIGQIPIGGGRLNRQADFLFRSIHLDDLCANHLVYREAILWVLDPILGKLRHVHQPFDALSDFHERPEI